MWTSTFEHAPSAALQVENNIPGVSSAELARQGAGHPAARVSTAAGEAAKSVTWQVVVGTCQPGDMLSLVPPPLCLNGRGFSEPPIYSLALALTA